jgi:Flp pilus assembly protein TadD
LRSVAFAVALLVVAAALVLPGVGRAQADAAATEAVELREIDRLARELRLDEALRRLDALLERSPRNVQARFLRAVLLGEAARSDEAAAAFEAMTQEFPELPEPYNNLAVIHAAAGRYEVARALLLRAIDVAPNYVTARENLGDLYLAMAADVYARALALDPGNAALERKLKLAREAAAGLRAGR